MIKLLVLLTFILQSGHRIQINDVTNEEVFGEHGKTLYHTLGQINVQPFDIKDSDAYVLLLTNIGGDLTLQQYEKFSFNDPTLLQYKWSYSFTIDTPEDGFSIYAVMVDKFNDKLEDQLTNEMKEMRSVEEVIGRLRRMDRVDPLNFNLFFVN